MTKIGHRQTLDPSQDKGRAIAASRHRAGAPSGLSPQAVSSEAAHRISRFASTVVHRIHRPPHPKGHRAFILGKQEWR